MERQEVSRVGLWGISGLGVLLTGCVINPYIKDGRLSNTDPNYTNCASVSKIGPSDDDRDDSVVAGESLEDAYTYAECVRRAMANKAGKYAWMNNAGGATLIQMAGFAGYSGIRGGHQAQVAAFSTGGAAAYGTQQYLYSKPREAIYWSGSQAIGCAIGVTRRRSLISSHANSLKALETQHSLDWALLMVRKAQANLDSVDGCADIKALNEKIENTQNAFRKREEVISSRKQRLDNVSASAAGDLLTATDAIRDTVNSQLAREQPEPSEIAKLLSNLKLPALNGMTPLPQPVEKASLGDEGIRGAADSLKISSSPVALKCTLALSGYQTAAETYLIAAAGHDRALADIESRLTAIEAMADADQKGLQMKHCTVGRTNMLLPFGLTFAQAGVQKVSAKKTLSIPITGGVPPYAITVVSASGGEIPALARQTDEGGFEVVFGGGSTVKGAKATFLVNDDVGASKPVSVEVVD